MKYFKTYEDFNLYDKLFGKEKNGVGSFKEIKFGEKSDNVKKLQEDLDSLGFKLYQFGIDSKFGKETAGKVKALFDFVKSKPDVLEYVEDEDLLEFDVENKLVTSEQVGLIDELAKNSNVKSKIEAHFKEMYKGLEGDIIGKEEIKKNIEDPEAFMNKLNEICQKLDIPNVNWLLLVMKKESGINPKAYNKNGGATGLIQFMPNTAKGLGTTTDALRSMNGVEQLEYVYKYFKPYTGKIKSVEDLYMITFFPVALGKSDDNVIQAKGLSAGAVAKANPVIDINKDGEITNGEFDEYVQKGIPNKWKELVNKNV